MDAQVDGGSPRVVRVRLSVKNPAVLDEIEMQDLHSLSDRVSELKSQGYDFAIGPYEGEIAVLFDNRIHVQEAIDLQPLDNLH